MNTKEKIGVRIRAARDALGLTLEQACDRIPGMKYSRLSNYEHGIREADLDVYVAIAAALQVSPAWLLCIEDQTPTPEETELLQFYRSADARGRETILDLAKLQSKRG